MSLAKQDNHCVVQKNKVSRMGSSRHNVPGMVRVNKKPTVLPVVPKVLASLADPLLSYLCRIPSIRHWCWRCFRLQQRSVGPSLIVSLDSLTGNEISNIVLPSGLCKVMLGTVIVMPLQFEYQSFQAPLPSEGFLSTIGILTHALCHIHQSHPIQACIHVVGAPCEGAFQTLIPSQQILNRIQGTVAYMQPLNY